MERDNNSDLGGVMDTSSRAGSVWNSIGSVLATERSHGSSSKRSDDSESFASKHGSPTVPGAGPASDVDSTSSTAAKAMVGGQNLQTEYEIPTDWYNLEKKIQLPFSYVRPFKAPEGCEKHVEYGFMTLFRPSSHPDWDREIYVYFDVKPFIFAEQQSQAKQDGIPMDQSLLLRRFRSDLEDEAGLEILQTLVDDWEPYGLGPAKIKALSHAFALHRNGLFSKLRNASFEATESSVESSSPGASNKGKDSSSIHSDNSVQTVIRYRPSSSSAERYEEDDDGKHFISRPQSSGLSVGTLTDADESVASSEEGILRILSADCDGEPVYEPARDDELWSRLKVDLKKRLGLQNLPPNWWKSHETFELGRVPPPARLFEGGKRSAGQGYITFYWLGTSPWSPELSVPYSVMIYLDPKHFRCRAQMELAAKYGIPEDCCLSLGGNGAHTTRELLNRIRNHWKASWDGWELDFATRESLWSAFLLHWYDLEQTLSREGSE
ncbi:hypothetical protein HD553DRAFT_356421 [Filobasidium floriforme]|uniref:uncharacterized protein n=1 Tax=Filobasidium floriforme TaxID=5210 RepID=UPI001E8DAE11|nr:uncharacterized protein HD553DRAFT_356421 [Filobasidium floriforme]KAH8084228.1 hypothetical protein HD553DRAFT_356421 [Filobasidium floriforme]